MRKFERWEIGRCVVKLRFSKQAYVCWLLRGVSLPSDALRTFRTGEVG